MREARGVIGETHGKKAIRGGGRRVDVMDSGRLTWRERDMWQVVSG
jgi:hypothetical protein